MNQNKGHLLEMLLDDSYDSINMLSNAATVAMHTTSKHDELFIILSSTTCPRQYAVKCTTSALIVNWISSIRLCFLGCSSIIKGRAWFHQLNLLSLSSALGDAPPVVADYSRSRPSSSPSR